MSEFSDKVNEELVFLRDRITALYDRAKAQAIGLIQKTSASFIELSNILRRNETLEDTFVDGSRILEKNGVVYDKEGWTNAFLTQEVRFLESYYTQTSYPMSMDGGRIIPGSDFSDIFLDREGFWGYFRDDDIAVDVEFSLAFNLGTDKIPVSANRIYLRTNNPTTVEAFYRPDFGTEWSSLGIKEGTHHTWTQDFTGVEIRFKAKAPFLAISFVAVANATFNTEGRITSTYYEVDDLRVLDIDMDADIPTGTAIRKFVHITDDPSETPPESSGWVSWEEEDIVTLAATEITAPIESGYIISSGYIEDSLVIRTEYQEWETVNTTDYALVVETVDRLGTDFLDIPVGYQVINDGIQALFIGTGEGRTEFAKDDDYVVQYDTTLNTIKVIDIPGGRLDGMATEPSAEVRLRKPVAVLQRRTFVLLAVDGDISVTIPTAGITIRTLHIGDTIEDERTTENVAIGTHTFSGKAGLNLIEVEGYNAGNPPSLSSTYTYFGSRYWLRQSDTNPPDDNEYYLLPVQSGLQVQTVETDMYARYLLPTDNNNVSVRFELAGTTSASPLLRGYRLVNTIDKV